MSDNLSIKWRKWTDPLKPPLDEHRRRRRLMRRQAKDPDENPDWWKKKKPFDESDLYRGPVIAGPYGVIPLFEESMPSKLWNFWVGDLNFDLTEAVFDAIDATPGVDVLRQWSRYRIWVGVGENFDEQAVRAEVEKNAVAAARPQTPAAAPPPPADPDDQRLLACKRQFEARGVTHWSAFIDEKGKLGFVSGESLEQVQADYAKHLPVKKGLRSWDK